MHRPTSTFKPPRKIQRRGIQILESRSHEMLKERGVTISEDEDSRSRDYFLDITIDRANYAPTIITSYSIGGESAHHHAKSHPFGLDKKVDASTFSSIATELNCRKESFHTLTRILGSLIAIFFDKEAFALATRISRNAKGELAVARSSFYFDDAAFRSCERQGDLQISEDFANKAPEEIEAEKDGIVYVK